MVVIMTKETENQLLSDIGEMKGEMRGVVKSVDILVSDWSEFLKTRETSCPVMKRRKFSLKQTSVSVGISTAVIAGGTLVTKLLGVW